MILHEFPRTYHELRHELATRYELEEANSVARIFLEHVTGISWREWQLRPDRAWDPAWNSSLEAGKQRLLAGDPVQHVTGQADFYSRTFRVTEQVLIPRQETEELVHWALEVVNPQGNEIRFADIGTGSGCIAVTLAAEWAVRHIATAGYALDLSEAALAIARDNARLNHVPLDFHQQNIFTAPDDLFSNLDLVISNPPYVTEADIADMSDLVLDHDPHLALFAPPEDALAFYRVIAQKAQTWLRPGGRLLLEINASLGPETAGVVREAGFQEIILRKDLNGRDRMICGSSEG